MATAVEPKLCDCGCGTELKPRHNGTFADYAPAGHDAKHKSALIREVLDGDDPVARAFAESKLESRGWTKFLEKARAVRAKKSEQSKRAITPRAHRSNSGSSISDPGLYGLSQYQFKMLLYPPNENTWVCEGPAHAESGPLANVGGQPCWFCKANQLPESRTLWAEYQIALEAFWALDFERIEEDAQVGIRMAQEEMPEIVRVARWLLRLYYKFTADEEEEEEVEQLEDEEAVPA